MGRKLVSVLALLLLLGICSVGASPLSLDWAFVKRTPSGGVVPVDFSERVNIKQGDLFKIYVRPSSHTFVYLFLYDASNKLQLLFPSNFGLFESPPYGNDEYFLPGGGNWYGLDATHGTERFYLVASSVRLRRLESLTVTYEREVTADQSDRAAQRRTGQAVLDELALLREQHSGLRTFAEKPVPIAGGSRDLASKVRRLATNITATNFYAKTFRLEH